MAERDFQSALIHLYANVDRYGADAAALCDRFALSPAERRALEELVTEQREGLLLVNQLSHDKQRRLIREALPTSRALAGARLESLLDAFQANRMAEGARDLATTIRTFADLTGDVVERETAPSRELELIRFEAVCAAVSLRSSSETTGELRSRRLTHDLRLSPNGAAAVIRCTYDVVTVLGAPSSLDLARLPARPCGFFLFNASADELNIMAVSSRLADLLAQFGRGCSVGEVLAALDGERAVAAASASIEMLLEAGAPFFSPAVAPDRAVEATGVRTG